MTDEIEAKTAIPMEPMLSALKSLALNDLYKVIKAATTEAEKLSKAGTKKSETVKKVNPNGSPQLKKPRAWVEFVLNHASNNGWDAFTIHKTVKGVSEEIAMLGSMNHNGSYVFEDSVTEKVPAGKKIILTHAMSLSKQYWSPKAGTGTHPQLYSEFEANYVSDVVPVAAEPVKTVIKTTAAAKEAEREVKRLAKEEEKELKKLAKEAEREVKRLAKEEEKELKKLAKLTPKVPAAAIAKVEKPVSKPKVKAVMEKWSCPADGLVHPWPYKGKEYLRNSDNEIWKRGSDGGCGDWVGIYLPEEDRVDDSVAAPEFEDE